MTQYLTQSHYRDTELASPCPIIITRLLGNEATSTMTQYPTQSHYRETEPASPCPIIIIRLGSDKYRFYQFIFDRELNSRSPVREVRTLLILPPRTLSGEPCIVAQRLSNWAFVC